MWQDKDEEGVVIDPDVYVLKLKLEEGEIIPFFLHDIIKVFTTKWALSEYRGSEVECQPFRRHYNRSNGERRVSTKRF